MNPVITKGADFTLDFQIGSEPYVERLRIESSSTANPAVITTDLPHQLTTSDLVRISGHRKNTIVNGTHAVTVISATTFSVPVAGFVTGEATGYVTKLKNVSLYSFGVEVKPYAGGSAVSGVSASIAVSDGTNKVVTVTIPKASTASLPTGTCLLVVTYVDDAEATHIITIECDVKNA